MDENAILRQQLIILNRQVNRPRLTNKDRLRLVLFARLTNFWQQALLIVQPDTLLRWHRELLRIYWRRKSKNNQHKPHINPEIIALIKQKAQENRLWGAERIRDELLKLGIRVSKRTIQRYMPKKRKKFNQTWATFLKNHAADIWAGDFTVVHDLFFRPTIFSLLLSCIPLEFFIQQSPHPPPMPGLPTKCEKQHPGARDPNTYGTNMPRTCHERDSKYGRKFATVPANSGIKELRSPIWAPKANVICERIIGSLKQECLDHMLIWHRSQVYRLVKEYTAYYNLARPHQGLQQRIPEHYAQCQQSTSECSLPRTVSKPTLGGLHHHYTCTPRLN